MKSKNNPIQRVLKEFKQNKYVQKRLLDGDFDQYLSVSDRAALKKIRGPDWVRPSTPEEVEKLNSQADHVPAESPSGE